MCRNTVTTQISYELYFLLIISSISHPERVEGSTPPDISLR